MALSGTEILQVQGVTSTGLPSGAAQATTTGAIAALAATESSPIVNTAITTVGNGTLTAAGLVGGLIVRSGSVANYSDTTDTAVNIIAGLPGFILNSTFLIRIKNNTAFTQTLLAGTGVTLPSTILIPAFSIGNYYAIITSATTVTIIHFNTTQFINNIYNIVPALTTLNTVGAGTITATSIISGYTSRSGAQLSAAFTDTTDTANNIIVASTGLQSNRIGAAVWWTYSNITNAPATITGGSGCTVSVITVIPPNSFVDYIVTYTAASTLTFAGVRQGYYPHGGTYTSIGSASVTISDANITTYSQVDFTLRSVGGTVGAKPIIKTITSGTGFTVSAGTSDLSTYNYNILG